MTEQSLPATVTETLYSHCVFKMSVSIQNTTKCEVHAVIRFLHTIGETAVEIHCQLVSVYSEDVMNRQNVAK
jgi:predicted transcriptional regulator